MEKYRVRQLENLQDKYTRRVQLIRDNYHQQVNNIVSHVSVLGGTNESLVRAPI